MKINLQYGTSGYPLTLPDEWNIDVIRKRPMHVLGNPKDSLQNALANPVCTSPLAELAKNASSACILICDITRPVPNGLLLPPIIRELLSTGIKPDQITVLVATGLHRPNEGEELNRLIGDPWVLTTVPVKNHFAKNEQEHVDLGSTKMGTPVLLDRRFMEADLKIVTGLVEPHFMAGYSGGRKVIVPGIAHEKTITRIHTANFLENPKATNCILNGNPLHEEQLEIVRKLGQVVAVNVVLDEERRPCLINFGEIEKSHNEAVEYIRSHAEIPITRQYDTVITSAAGAPLDATYYQTVKAMVGAVNAIRPGGTMFIASACQEGLGSPEYVNAQKRLVEQGPEKFLKGLLPKDHAAVDEWQTEMQLRATEKGTVCLYTGGLTNRERELTGVQVVQSLEESVKRQVDKSGDRRIAVIPEGPYVIPVYHPAKKTA